MKRTPLKKHRKPTAMDLLYTRAVREARKAEGKENTFHWQPHHAFTPHKKRLFCFALIPASLHAKIHASPKWARAEGWMDNIDGSLTVELPEIKAAMEREARLLMELENP